MQGERGAGSRDDFDRQHRTRLTALVEAHRATMVRFADSIMSSGHADAECAVQDALVILLERPRAWPDADAEALAVVMQHIKNAARNRRRAAHTRARKVISGIEPSVAADPWHEAWKIHVRESLDAALAGLTEAERSVITMRVMSGLPYRTIAGKRNSSVNTVKVLIRRARARMRESLQAVRNARPNSHTLNHRGGRVRNTHTGAEDLLR